MFGLVEQVMSEQDPQPNSTKTPSSSSLLRKEISLLSGPTGTHRTDVPRRPGGEPGPAPSRSALLILLAGAFAHRTETFSCCLNRGGHPGGRGHEGEVYRPPSDHSCSKGILEGDQRVHIKSTSASASSSSAFPSSVLQSQRSPGTS